MKYLNPVLFLFAALIFISCSSDDDSSENVSEQPDTSTPTTPASDLFFPLLEDSYWTYQNTSDQTTDITRDSIYLSNFEQLNNLTYANLDAEMPISGFMTQILSENILRNTDNELLINGALTTSLFEGLAPISVPLDDFILFDESKDSGTVLNQLNGEIQQDFNGIPLNVDYTITTIQGEQSDNFTTPTGATYTNVLTSQFVASIAISAEIGLAGTIIDIPILLPQNVIVATNSYAQNVGLVFSDLNFSYQLEDFSGLGFTIPIPAMLNTTSIQELDTFSIGN